MKHYNPEDNYRKELYEILTSKKFEIEIDADLNQDEKIIFKELFLGNEIKEEELIKKILGND